MIADFAIKCKPPLALSVIAGAMRLAHKPAMISSEEVLDRLAKLKVKRNAIARTLGIDPARVTEMYKGERRLLHDEGKKLVEVYGLEANGEAEALSVPIARLLVLHASRRIGAALAMDDPLVAELALDFQAFSEFARRPDVRDETRPFLDLHQFSELLELRRALEASSQDSNPPDTGRNPADT